jgi:hypothetical protein
LSVAEQLDLAAAADGLLTPTAAELSVRAARTSGCCCDRGTAAMFLGWWLAAGLVAELWPGRFTLTAKGRRLGVVLFEADVEDDGRGAVNA